MTTWTGPRNAAAVCPECQGPRSYNVVFVHLATCSLLAQLDRTQARDYNEYVRSRPASPAELVLCHALGADLSGGVLATIVSRPPIWIRKFTDSRGGFDPDIIT